MIEHQFLVAPALNASAFITLPHEHTNLIGYRLPFCGLAHSIFQRRQFTELLDPFLLRRDGFHYLLSLFLLRQASIFWPGNTNVVFFFFCGDHETFISPPSVAGIIAYQTDRRFKLHFEIFNVFFFIECTNGVLEKYTVGVSAFGVCPVKQEHISP